MADDKVKVNKTCCCGCSFRDGTFIIGTFCLFGAIYGSIANLLNLIFIVGNRHGGQTDGLLLAAAVVTFILCVISAILCVALLFGASNNNVKEVVPWYYFHLTLWWISLVGSVIQLFFLAIESFVHGIILGLIVLTGLGIQRYLISVIHNYIEELREGKYDQQQHDNFNLSPVNNPSRNEAV